MDPEQLSPALRAKRHASQGSQHLWSCCSSWESFAHLPGQTGGIEPTWIIWSCSNLPCTSWQHCQNTLNNHWINWIPFFQWIYSTYFIVAFFCGKIKNTTCALKPSGSLAWNTLASEVLPWRQTSARYRFRWDAEGSQRPKNVKNGLKFKMFEYRVSLKNIKSLNLRRVERKPAHFCPSKRHHHVYRVPLRIESCGVYLHCWEDLQPTFMRKVIKHWINRWEGVLCGMFRGSDVGSGWDRGKQWEFPCHRCFVQGCRWVEMCEHDLCVYIFCVSLRHLYGRSIERYLDYKLLVPSNSPSSLWIKHQHGIVMLVGPRSEGRDVAHWGLTVSF